MRYLTGHFRRALHNALCASLLLAPHLACRSEQPPEGSDASLRLGEWNRLRVRAVGDEVTTWLNGQQMVQISDEKIGAAEGVIALQIHDGGGIKVRWRNLAIRSLDGGS